MRKRTSEEERIRSNGDRVITHDGPRGREVEPALALQAIDTYAGDPAESNGLIRRVGASMTSGVPPREVTAAWAIPPVASPSRPFRALERLG